MSGPRLLVAALLLTGCSEFFARDNCHDPANPPCDGGPDQDAAANPQPDIAAADMAVDTSPCNDAGWCRIPKGAFWMGGPKQENKRQVTLTHDFEISRTEVTQGQFMYRTDYNHSCHGSTPENSGDYNCQTFDDRDTCSDVSCPVELVSWHEAARYCNKLSGEKKLTECYSCDGDHTDPANPITCHNVSAFAGRKIYDCPGYRLPTEAEWEYAYRAGTDTRYYNGSPGSSTPLDDCIDIPVVSNIAWYCHNSGTTKVTQPTGGKAPNAWGLHDMAGNVWEWCHDRYQPTLPSNPVVDPVVTSGTMRVYRGGSVEKEPVALTAHHRPSQQKEAKSRFGDHGFRCVRSIIP